MIKQVLSTAGSFLPPGLPAGKTLSLDSFDTSGDPLTISNLQAGIFQYTFLSAACIQAMRHHQKLIWLR